MTMSRLAATLAAAIAATSAAAAIAQTAPPADALDATARANLGADVQAGMAPVQLTPRPPGAEVTGSAVVDRGTDVESRVTVNSLRPDSARGEYRVDFATLDADRSGSLSRAEVAGNAELSREFDAVDTSGDGVLDRDELSGWQR